MPTEQRRLRCARPTGQTVHVIETEFFTEHRPNNGPAQFIPGRIEWALVDGSSVNKMRDGRFEVVQTGEILTPA
ncbi:hypothetical protein [Caulobacter sp. NIBR2454]|uniref:hypothetical protein n=1 Tax=Caulobacter sp. NIBR2454 TaxID=3015996 RepID=UPI0022B5F218|nr:hypothetical protein [Caulobacter sp. NIBR2454]